MFALLITLEIKAYGKRKHMLALCFPSLQSYLGKPFCTIYALWYTNCHSWTWKLTNQPWQTQTHPFSQQQKVFLFLLVSTSFALSLSLSYAKLQTYCNNVYYKQEPLVPKSKDPVGFLESQGKVVKLEVTLSSPGRLTQFLLQQIKTCQITLQLHRFAIPFRSLLHQFFLILLLVISMLACIYFVYNFKTFW